MITDYASKRFLHLLKGAERVVVSCHARPDGDAVGSLCAMLAVLQGLGKSAHAVVPTPLAQNLLSLPGSERVVVFDRDATVARRYFTECDLAIFLDLNDLSRLDRGLRAVAEESSVPRIVVDHHLAPRYDQFDLVVSRVASSSTCELLFSLLKASLGSGCFTPEVAQSLYSGIVTDTGGFSYSCHESTFLAAAELMRYGVDQARFRQDFFGSFSESRVRLYGFAMSTRMELFAGGRAALIPLSREDLDRFSFEAGDTEGLANEPLSIKGVDVSVLLMEHGPGNIRVSLRSRNDVRVNGLASRFFNGGGHAFASGGSLSFPFVESVDFARARVSEFIEAL